MSGVFRAVEAYCLRQGARPGPGVNNLVPHDPVRAHAMARRLRDRGYDEHVAIAPEGWIYAFFLERLGCSIRSVHVDYPPTALQCRWDLGALAGRRVLVIEDDVIGGATLRLFADAVAARPPARLDLYLGHAAFVQHLGNVPPTFTTTWLAERVLSVEEYQSAAVELARDFPSDR